MKLKLTESEYMSFIESNMDFYYITSVWIGKLYTTGKRPKEVDGIANFIELKQKPLKKTIDEND